MMRTEIIVLESNQNHATITDSGICTTLPASMGMGGGQAGQGYPCVLVVKDDEDTNRKEIF